MQRFSLGGNESHAKTLPRGWKVYRTYMIQACDREGLSACLVERGIDYAMEFESESSMAPEVFLGSRTAYYLICHQRIQEQEVPVRCRGAVRRALVAGLRGDWHAVRSVSFITPQPSQDNLEFTTQGASKRDGKILLVKLRGE